jgi:uncharacterized protein (AIM24 family)
MQQRLTGAMEAGKRVLAGESLALRYFTSTGGAGVVAFAGVLPGERRALELSPGSTWMAERDAFVAAGGLGALGGLFGSRD